MKYLQFNRETEQTESESRSAPHSPADSPIRNHPDAPPTGSTPARDRRQARHSRTPPWKCRGIVGSVILPVQHRILFQIAEVRVWSGNLKYRALGDYAGTGCAERFFFSRHLLFSQSPERFQGAPAVSAAESRRPASWARIGRTKTIRPWQKARGNELVWCSQQMSEHRASPSSLMKQAAADSDILCALVKQNKYNTAYNNYQCRNLESVTTIQVIFVQISIQHCCSCWNRPSK
ncbi:Hypothetical_protein [Hexamita inflata]|uniref:Hypothetical_protein n=1 Tax=Hexamita inflata TaxID=28002 RepID=A0AA86RP32_9EUKA|nr:Hypothetical protein HINF_LOCUS65968 [Hexamita inflata]